MSGILGAMTQAPQLPPAGWYPDPAGTGAERYWDGVAWSQATRDVPTPASAPPPPPHPGQPGHGPAGAAAPNYGQPMTSVGPRVAPFGWRVLGFVIDYLGIQFLVSAITAAMGLDAQLLGELNRWSRDLTLYSETMVGPFPMPGAGMWTALVYSALVGIAVFGLYRVILLGTLSATLGQLAVGLRTVPAGADAEAKLGWGQAVVRGLMGAVLYQHLVVGAINALFAAVTAKRQTLSDMISKTQVLKIR